MATIGFAGGDKLAKYLNDLAVKLGGPGTLKVGFLEGATYPDGTSVPMVAFLNEYGHMARGGSYYVVARPFFRNMIAAKSPAWGEELAKILVAVDMGMGRALRLMGERIAGQLQASIVDTNSPPLAGSTIKAKGFAKPLIDTNVMRNGVGYEVGEKRYKMPPTAVAQIKRSTKLKARKA